MNILITGISGFVGRNLVVKLLDDSRVNKIVGINRTGSSLDYSDLNDERVSIYSGDITNFLFVEYLIKEHEISHIFHLGAVTLVQNAEKSMLRTFDVNVIGTLNILEAANRAETVNNVMISTSDKSYGHTKELPYKENTRFEPIGVYETSKSCADLIGQMYGKNFNCNVGIVRCCNIFGPRDPNNNRIIPYIVLSALRNESPVIRRASCIRELIFVEDVVNNLIGLSNLRLMGQPVNVGSGVVLSMGDLASKICNIVGNGVEPELNEGMGDEIEIKEQYLDSSLLKRLLGKDLSNVTYDNFDKCLSKTVDWYKVLR